MWSVKGNGDSRFRNDRKKGEGEGEGDSRFHLGMPKRWGRLFFVKWRGWGKCGYVVDFASLIIFLKIAKNYWGCE